MFQKASLVFKIIKSGKEMLQLILQLKNTESIKAIQKQIDRPQSNGIYAKVKGVKKGALRWLKNLHKNNECTPEKQKVTELLNFATTITYPITIVQIEEYLPKINELVKIAESNDRIKSLSNEDLVKLSIELGRFFQAQCAYDTARYFLGKGLKVREDFIDPIIEENRKELYKLQKSGFGFQWWYHETHNVYREYPKIAAMISSELPSIYLSEANLFQSPRVTCLFVQALVIQVKELGRGHDITFDTFAKLMRICGINNLTVCVLYCLHICLFIDQTKFPRLFIASILMISYFRLMKETQLIRRSMLNWLLKFLNILTNKNLRV